jgi:hypothetical protein
MQFAQLSDRVTGGGAGTIDVRAFPGTWRNSNPDSTGIARIVISESGGNLSLQVVGGGAGGRVGCWLWRSGPIA